MLERALQSESIFEAEEILNEAFFNYKKYELEWIASRFGEWWRQQENQIEENARRYDELIEEDKQQYLKMLSQESEMLSL